MFVSRKLSQMERGDPQTTAVLLLSKLFKAVGAKKVGSEMTSFTCNMAAPSPNGQRMAICSSRPELLILSAVRAVQD